MPEPSEHTGTRGEVVFATDSMIDQLLGRTDDAQREADKKRRSYSEEERRRLRVRAKRDLFFLCTGILGNKRLTVNFHGDLCTKLRTSAKKYRFREWLLARGNFKSTIITIAHSIQIVLPYDKTDAQYDDDPEPLGWPDSLGTDCRLLIAHETHESAARFLYAITNHFTTNPLLMALFPEAIPSLRKHRINKWELELPRSTSGNPEPTIDTLGVGGKSQGRHYNYIKLDDIYGDKARDSETESNTTKQWFDNIQSFFSLFSQDRLDLIGTRYSFDDIYEHAHTVYGTQLFKYIRKIEEPTGNMIWSDQEDKMVPEKYITFPEEFTKESLEIIKKNKKVYNAQYLNDPSDNINGFDQTWWKEYYWLDNQRLCVFTGKSRDIINVRDLDICFLIDPGTEKTGGFVVTGMDYRRRVFILASLLLELNTPQLTELVFKQAVRWQPRTVAPESDFFMSALEHWWYAEMILRGIRFHITPVHTKKLAKDIRISGLQQYYAAGQIYHNEQQPEIKEEFRVWGKSKNIHIYDALAYGPEVWRAGWAPGTRVEMNKVTDDDIGDNRDVETGYSAIG